MSYTLRGRIETRLAAALVPLLVACAIGAAITDWWPIELAGLMLGDNHSFLAQNPDWKPFDAFGGAKFRIIDLLKAGLQ